MDGTWKLGKRMAGLLLLSALGWMPQASAKWVNADLLITPEQLQKSVEKADWVVVDCRDLDDYLKGHIPGAISLGGPCGKVLRDPSSRVLEVKKYEDVLGKVGIGNATHVVVYHGDMSDLTDATTAFWILEYLGHDKVQLLNGGIDAWRKAGLRLADKPTRKEPTTFRAKVVASRYASTDEIVKIARGQLKG
ncbi:MAG: rhodanese-like domain-containing protein, partial [Betaproteobacteria bacterium]|nr:rhodanese-like domain-containing protein [Betaproteobacteria bacterium]